MGFKVGDKVRMSDSYLEKFPEDLHIIECELMISQNLEEGLYEIRITRPNGFDSFGLAYPDELELVA